MKLGIVTDSTSDLPKYLIEQYELEVVPSILIIDGKEYADGVGLSREDFYRQLPSLRTQPTTAAPRLASSQPVTIPSSRVAVTISSPSTRPDH